MDVFGNPSIVWGTLTLKNFVQDIRFRTAEMNWFIRVLSRFAGSKTLSLQLESISARDHLWLWWSISNPLLEPLLGMQIRVATGSEVYNFIPCNVGIVAENKGSLWN